MIIWVVFGGCLCTIIFLSFRINSSVVFFSKLFHHGLKFGCFSYLYSILRISDLANKKDASMYASNSLCLSAMHSLALSKKNLALDMALLSISAMLPPVAIVDFKRLTPELRGAAGKPRYEAKRTTRVRLSDRLGGGAGDDAGATGLCSFLLPLPRRFVASLRNRLTSCVPILS